MRNAGTASGLTWRFYWRQVVLLALLALVFWSLNRYSGVDFWLSSLFFDPASAGFPLKNAVWLDWLNHRLAKYAVIVFTLGCYLLAARRRDSTLLLTALAITLSTLAVSLLKAASPHSCPWDLTQFGGKADFFYIFDAVSSNPGPGNCFPGGHAAGGFALMAGYLGFHATRPRLARGLLLGGLLLGSLMGLGQIARGAHFLSHNLWSAWIVWAVALTVFALSDAFRQPRHLAAP